MEPSSVRKVVRVRDNLTKCLLARSRTERYDAVAHALRHVMASVCGARSANNRVRFRQFVQRSEPVCCLFNGKLDRQPLTTSCGLTESGVHGPLSPMVRGDRKWFSESRRPRCWREPVHWPSSRVWLTRQP